MRFDLTAYYTLLRAFDLTGRTIFGSAWRGDEAFAGPANDPEQTRRERQEILAKVHALLAQEREHRAILSLDPHSEEGQKAAEALDAIRREVEAKRQAMHKLPEITDWWIEDHNAFTRRKRVESELRAAFAAKALPLQVGTSTGVEWKSWARQDGFHLRFDLSQIDIPAQAGLNSTSGPGFVPKVALDAWLNRFEAPSPEGAALTPDEQLANWLRNRVREAGRKAPRKADCKAQALREVSGLSARAFDRVWSDTVPEDWRKSGRRQSEH